MSFKFLRDYDFIGYEVMIKYRDHKSAMYQTKLGGLFSFLFVIFVVAFTVVRVTKIEQVDFMP
jgi:hypothetical protein